MIRTLLLSLLLLIGYSGYAQTVGYSFKPFSANGGNMKYSVAKQDTSYFIIATVKSEKLNFLKEPTMLIKTFDGQIIKLSGYNIGSGSITAGIISGNIVIPVTEISSMAQFTITEKQFEQLNNGVSKVRLSTIPIEHEKTFNKDKIGKKLYQLFLKQKAKDDNF